MASSDGTSVSQRKGYTAVQGSVEGQIAIITAPLRTDKGSMNPDTELLSQKVPEPVQDHSLTSGNTSFIWPSIVLSLLSVAALSFAILACVKHRRDSKRAARISATAIEAGLSSVDFASVSPTYPDGFDPTARRDIVVSVLEVPTAPAAVDSDGLPDPLLIYRSNSWMPETFDSDPEDCDSVKGRRGPLADYEVEASSIYEFEELNLVFGRPTHDDF